MSHHRRSISSSSRIGGRCLALLLPLLAALLPQASAQTVVDSDLEVTSVVSGLSGPTGMVFISDDTILVTQKANGQVRRVTGGVLQAGAVLDVAVNATSERGLLGITRDPDFIHNGYIYLYYTESGTGSDGGTAVGNRVYRYTWNGSALVDPLLILDLPVNPGPSHDGGIIDFGPDDQLYVIIGDLNRNGKLENFPEGADPDDTGVILRVGNAHKEHHEHSKTHSDGAHAASCWPSSRVP